MYKKMKVYPGGRGWTPGEEEYGDMLVRDVFIDVDGDIRLEAKVSYPTDLKTGQRAEGAFPVLVEFTPYDGEAPHEALPYAFFTHHGYITAVVHPRGSGKSTGGLEQFTSRDGLDGAVVVDWASKLDGSDGRVGFYGSSYPGALGLATAAKVGKDSPLKAVVAYNIGLGAQYRQAWTNNGLPTVLMMGYSDAMMGAFGGNEGAKTYFKEFYDGFLTGDAPAYEGDYWKDRLPLSWAKDIVENGVPVLQCGGWDDLNETGAVRGYAAFQNAVSGRDIYAAMDAAQEASPRYQLIIGNWGHGVGNDIGMSLEWFDTWIKRVDTGLAEVKTPMHLHENGTNRWTNFSHYPLVEDYNAWMLGVGGSLTQNQVDEGTRTLKWGRPEEEGCRLDFTSEPVVDGMTIAGPSSLTFTASTDSTNLEILAKLFDVAPDGSIQEISRGALLGSMRELDEGASWVRNGVARWPWPKLDKDEYLEPEKKYRFTMALEPVQYGLKPGHCLRLTLATQSLPAEPSDLGFMVAEPAGLTAPQQETVPGTYTLYFDRNEPATLAIPEVPFEAFKEVLSGVTPTAWTDNGRTFDDSGEFTKPLEW